MGLITSTGDNPLLPPWGKLFVKLKDIVGNPKWVYLLIFAFILLPQVSYSQATGPCDGANRWDGGATWNADGSINDAPNSPSPNGIIRCGSSAETQSNIFPFNNAVYDPGTFTITVESDGGCVDPSTGLIVNPKNPTEGQPIIWLNFDVRAYAGSFDIQINDNSGDNIGWALYVSADNQAGTTYNNAAGDYLSGNCNNLTKVACGVESSSTWNSIPIDGIDFLEATNFYLAIWDQDADGDLSVNNFKARYGCGEPDLCSLSVGEPEVGCVIDGSYTVTVPINGSNAQYRASDENATDISPDLCLGNLGEGGNISGSFVLTYPAGVDYNISIIALSPPDMTCTDPFNPTQCTGTVSGEAPVATTVTANDDSVCIGSTIQLTATPAGGTWSGAHISAGGLFNAAGLTADTYEVTYTYSDGNECENSDTATVTVVSPPEVDELDDVTACDSYTLLALSAGNQYFTEPDGGGEELEAGAVITSDQIIYIYAAATAPCVAGQSSFTVTINESVVADELDDVTACDSYTLLALSAGNQYFTEPDGGGEELEAGAVITSDQIIYIYAAATAPCVAGQSSFTVTINESVVADELDDVTACDSYTLLALSAGNQYFTEPDGGGEELEAGAVITSDQIIYIYAAATAPCEPDQTSFVVTINDSPEAVELADVTRCDSYTLPELASGNQYFTGEDGSGTELFAGASITSTQTIYIYAAATAPCEPDQTSFVVTINDSPEAVELADVTRCDSYTLPELASGNQYFTGEDGSGTELFAGASITTTQTIYIYAAATAPCEPDQTSFVVTINDSPEAVELADVTRCDSYILPELASGNQYFTGEDGSGTELFAGASITSTQTIYIYAAATAPCEPDQTSFVVTINDSPEAVELADVTRCDSYILPELASGNQYFTGEDGSGTELFAGASITTTQTIYIYAAATAPCEPDQTSFVVTINDSPEAVELADVTRCDSYTLPELASGNQYFTGEDGSGTELFAGASITTTQTIYIYAAATAPCEPDQTSFVVTINDSPEAVELADVTRCDSYILPELASGNQYFTGEDGSGTELFAGASITTTQTIYIYAAATAPCEPDQTSFVVTINDSPEAVELADVTRCDSYTLPELASGNQYFTGEDGSGTELFAGASITTTQTIYIYAAATAPCEPDQTSFVVTINDSPEAVELADVTRCDSYTLPELASGNQYFTGEDGSGTELFAGASITTTQTIYIYAAATAPCEPDQTSFVVTINDSPEAVELADVTRCDSYTLPELASGNQYFTGEDGSGTELFAGASITSIQTIYIYAAATAPCEPDQTSFVVTINDSPEAAELADVTRCDSYILPELASGNQYFTGEDGSGTELFAGASITSTQTIYIYAAATAPCVAGQSSFTVTINDSAQIPEYQITQADCLGGNGGLAFVNVGDNFYYSIDGGSFILYSGEIALAVGDYDFIVKYGINGCPSEEFMITIGRPQEVTVTLLYEVEQPECESLVGTIRILNEEVLNYTVENTETNVVYYNNVAYPNTGFTDLPSGEYLITGVSANGCISGSVLVTLTEPDCQVAEGCTLGYWKTHTDRWCDEYQTCTLYGDVFENAPSALAKLTLLEVLNLGGGGINNLGRQSVAALLNTCSDEVDYYYTDQMELIDYVNSNFTRSLAGAAGTYLDELNNAGCPLGGTQATSEPSEGCETDTPDSGNNGNNGIPGKGNGSVAISGFSAYPVPFKETLNIQYEFDYVSPATIQFFDMRGRLLRSVKELKATRGVVTTIDIDYSMRPSQTYIVKVTTDREVITKQIVSSK